MKEAKFVNGSIMRHVVVMSLSSSIGITALFLVDLIDMYFLSLLGEVELASAVGYAGTILYFTTSVCIGLSIAIGALVSRSIGAKKLNKAKKYLINGYAMILIATILLATGIFLSVPFWVELLGAKGKSAMFASQYLYIMIPSMPILGIAMSSGFVLRAVGDAKRSMNSTLVGGLVNAVLDPIFIFGFDLSVRGAAIASVFARCTMLAMALYPVYKKHNLIIKFKLNKLFDDLKPILTIGIPAIITNVATPLGMAYVIAQMALYGDGAVAGMSVTSRLTPVAFGVVFAVSGAVGPIIGQNFGAGLVSRVRRTISDSLLFVMFYVTAVSIILFLIPELIGKTFKIESDAQLIIDTFCKYVSITYIFAGANFIANAAFNNLGKPNYSTIVNLGKATVGTIPFVYYGSLWYGAVGVLIGQAIGAVVFGIVSIVWVFLLVSKLKPHVLIDPVQKNTKLSGPDRRHSLRDTNVAVRQSP